MECDPRRHEVNLRSVSSTKPNPSPDPEYGYYTHRGLQVAGESGQNVGCMLLEEGEWKAEVMVAGLNIGIELRRQRLRLLIWKCRVPPMWL